MGSHGAVARVKAARVPSRASLMPALPVSCAWGRAGPSPRGPGWGDLAELNRAFKCVLKMFPQVEVDENGKIVDARFKTFGCGSAIASSSLATEWVKGKTVRELRECCRACHVPVFSVGIMEEMLSRESLHCSVL